MILRVAADDDLDAELHVHGPLGHIIHRVVGALGVHIRPQAAQGRHEVRFVKGHHMVHAGQGGDDLRPLSQGHQGSAGALQAAD